MSSVPDLGSFHLCCIEYYDFISCNDIIYWIYGLNKTYAGYTIRSAAVMPCLLVCDLAMLG